MVFVSAGIYMILNTINNHKYIGSTVNFRKRWNTHQSALNKNCHHSIHLQNAWNKYGKDSFKFVILEEVSQFFANLLIVLEQQYLDDYQPEYNICKIAYSSLGRKHTEESKLKMSQIKRTGQKHNEETKEKIRQSLISRNAKLLKQVGRVHTEESKLKMSNSKRKYTYIITDPNGIEYITTSLNKFCKDNNLLNNVMYDVLHGNRKSHRGYQVKYVDQI